jgi:superfamily II DNA or RNA helicase
MSSREFRRDEDRWKRQQRAINRVDRLIADDCYRIFLQAPTGFGKTLVGSYLVKRIHHSGGRIWWTAPLIKLVIRRWMYSPNS